MWQFRRKPLAKSLFFDGALKSKYYDCIQEVKSLDQKSIAGN